LDSGALELDTRRRVFEFVNRNPGCHLREIQRGLEMPIGLLNFHLGYLETNELLTSKTDRYYKRYYAEGRLSSQEKRILSSLRQENPRRIILHLLLHPSSGHGEMLEVLGFKPSTLSFYLKDLLSKGIVYQRKEGRRRFYTIPEPDMVVRVLITYRPSFLDTLVDRFLDAWFAGDDD